MVEVSICLSAEHQTGSQAEDSHRAGVSGGTTTDSALRTEVSSANGVILFLWVGGRGLVLFFLDLASHNDIKRLFCKHDTNGAVCDGFD